MSNKVKHNYTFKYIIDVSHPIASCRIIRMILTKDRVVDQ